MNGLAGVGFVLADSAAAVTRPCFNVFALPDLAHFQHRVWLGEVRSVDELLDALSAYAEHAPYLGGSYEVVHGHDHSHHTTSHLTTSHVTSRVSFVNTATETLAAHRCLRPGCGRRLTSPASVAKGYGPKCAAKIRKAQLDEARADFTSEQQAKADELIRDGGLVPHAHRGVFEAVSSDGTATYLVHAKACNCPGGLRSKRACYHQLGARILGIASRRSLAKAA